MQTTITVTITPEGNLVLPPEIREKVQAGEQYLATVTENSIILEKVKTNKLTWDELRKRREKLGDEREEMTVEEICEIVREVRKYSFKS
jgi:bifunctional DNA-binding transcriptional regulator/antitoxin component of YhaV-PrlF toxin-antitoxin module